MIFSLNYIIYIIYSFLLLFALYICLLAYKKYSFIIFNMFDKEIIISEKYSEKKNKKHNQLHTSLIANTSKKIKKLKNKYKIKLTEKTYEEIKFISHKPNYIIYGNTSNLNFKNINNLNKIKKYNENITVQKITQIYLETKQIFYTKFIDSKTNKYFINNINDFKLFHKANLFNNSNTNILIKFYNNTNIDKHIYIFVLQHKIIKIINNDEYDNICIMIEKNNGIFMLNDDDEKTNIIGYGSYIQSKINSNDIKKTFFSNSLNYETNKNFKILNEFQFIKIYFYVCNKI